MLLACGLLLLLLLQSFTLASTVSLLNVTIYGFGTDFSAKMLHKLTFDYGLEVSNNAEIVYTAIPLEGIRCGYEGNTNDACASMFHLFTNPDANLDFDNGDFGRRHRRLDEEDDAVAPGLPQGLEVDFAVSPEPLVIPSIPDLQNYPFFIYGVAPVFNVPGVTQLTLKKSVLAKIFRACNYLETSAPSTIGPTTASVGDTAAPSASPTVEDASSAPSQQPILLPTVQSTFSGCLNGSISRWDDPLILATNPPSIHHLLTAAGEIKVFVESDAGPVTHAFKRALSRFDQGFSSQIGDNDDTEWHATNFPKVGGNYGTLRKVRNTKGSISYSTLEPILHQAGVYAVDLIVDGVEKVIKASSASLYAAFTEIGMDFGNDGTDPNMLRVDLTSATGVNSWPISLIAYISTRKEHTSHNCKWRKLSLISFLNFLSTKQGDPTQNTGLASFSMDAGKVLLGLLQNQLKCDGELVYTPPPEPPAIAVFAEESLHSLMETFLQSAAFDNLTVIMNPPATHTGLREGWICMANPKTCPYHTDMIVIADDNLSEYLVAGAKANNDKYTLFTLPYLAVATGFITNFCQPGAKTCDYIYRTPLVLDVATAANILDGNIRWWNDTAIKALNPSRNLPNEPIVVVAGPKYSSYSLEFVQKVRASYNPSFGYRMGDETQRDTFLEAWWDVALTPYSISFVVLNGTVVEGVKTVTLRNDLGVEVAASPESIEACAVDTYDIENNLFRLMNSMEQDCYALVTTYTIFVSVPVVYAAPARLLNLLFQRSLRKGQGRTAVYNGGFGTLVDLKVNDGYDLQKLNMANLETIKLLSTGHSVLQVQHELNLIPHGAIQAMYSVLGIELFCFIALAVWTVRNRNRKLINNSSPLFLIQVLFGAATMASTVVPLSRQDSDLVPRGMTREELVRPEPVLDLACASAPIFFSMGFAICFSAMFLKAWRLIRIFNNSKLKNLFLKDRQLMMYQTAVIAVAIGLNALWAGIDPMIWIRFPEYENADGLVIGSSGVCYSRGGIASAIPLIIGIVGFLILGNYLSFVGRKIPTEFNESKWTAFAMTMILESFIIAVPVLILSNDDPVAGFVIKCLVCLLVPGGTVGLIFGPKVMLAYGIGEEKGTSNPWRFVRASDSSGGASNSKNNQMNISKVANQQNHMLSQIVRGTNQEIQFLSSPSIMSSSVAHNNFPSASASTSQALARVLQDDPSRRKFRRYLKTLKMEENVRFWDATMLTKAETNENKRYSGTRAVIQSFVMDNAPFQVNLSSATKQEIIAAYDADDKQKLKDPTFFDKAMAEMFDDLRQSDAFRAFLDNDTFSTQNLA